MRCRNCGQDNPVDAAFCGLCGFAVVPDQNGAPPWPVPSATGNGAGRLDSARSDTTRYLCAAVQMNSKLATSVIDEIIDEEFKPPPTSPDVDLGPVLRHALAARSRQLARDFALTALLIVAVWTFLTFQGTAFVITLVLAWAVLFAEQLVATYGVVARRLRSDVFDPAAAPEPSDDRLRLRLRDLHGASQGNVTVYSDFVPFVGSGVPIGAWSFALDVQRPAEGRQCVPFTATEIHDVVLSHLQQLNVAGLWVEDRVFVDGGDLRGDPRFLPAATGPPSTSAPPEMVRRLIDHPEDRVRPYTCVRVAGWGGQLVLSTFVRCVVTPQHLFVEVSNSLLAPVQHEYQEVDHLLPQPTGRQMARIAGRCALRTPVRLVLAPGTVVRALGAPISQARRRARQRREITQTLRFDYGSSRSPRERAADERFQRYFQQLDRDMHVKIIERTVLAAIVDFLDDKGIDTTELVQRQTTILNNGVFVTGGATVNAQSMAGGTGAQASTGLPRLVEAARGAAPAAKS
jgi:hypothetical protein